MKLKIFYNTTFSGFYGVGTSAVVVANSQKEAAELLSKELIINGLPQKKAIKESEMVELELTVERAIVLNNGDY